MGRRAAAVALLIFPFLPIGGQSGSIEVKRVRTMIDQDGRGFTGPPRNITALSGGRFVLEDDGVSANRPVVIDSTGRFVRFLAPRGSGPGEIPGFVGAFRVGRGDSLFISSPPGLMVFDAQLKFARTITLESAIADFQITDSGFVSHSHRPDGKGKVEPFHLLSREGRRVRSMGVDTFSINLHKFFLTPSPGGFWANQYPTHRFERWSSGGTLLLAIDHRPSWFYPMPRGRLAPFTTVRSIREVDGRLWVLNWVPSPRIDQIVQEATGRRSVASEAGPRLPIETMYTTVLEVYDATTGKQLAERALNALGVQFIGDDRFLIYSVNPDDLAQLEVWEMKYRPE
jgi:hypothetical protein